MYTNNLFFFFFSVPTKLLRGLEKLGNLQNFKGLKRFFMPLLKLNFCASCHVEEHRKVYFLFVSKSEILIIVIWNWNILVFSSNTTYIVLLVLNISGVKQKNFLKMVRKKVREYHSVWVATLFLLPSLQVQLFFSTSFFFLSINSIFAFVHFMVFFFKLVSHWVLFLVCKWICAIYCLSARYKKFRPAWISSIFELLLKCSLLCLNVDISDTRVFFVIFTASR